MTEYTKIEKLLRERLAVLQEKVEEIDDELEAPGDDDFEEMASESQADQVLEGVGLVANDEINQIQLALRRIEEGSYGECGRCGNTIAAKRLEVVPHANFCVECEEFLEKQGKR